MDRKHDPSLTLAIGASGKLVNVHDVERGKKCGCVCLECGGPLLANKGKIKAFYFSHLPNSNCSATNESILHRAAKRIISEEGEIYFGTFSLKERKFSEFLGLAFKNECRHTVGVDGWLTLGRVDEEKRFAAPSGEYIQPDLTIYRRDEDQPYCLVEILVTHAVDDTKKQKIRNLGIPTVEIDLSKLYTSRSMANLKREDLLSEINNIHNRGWPLPLRSVVSSKNQLWTELCEHIDKLEEEKRLEIKKEKEKEEKIKQQNELRLARIQHEAKKNRDRINLEKSKEKARENYLSESYKSISMEAVKGSYTVMGGLVIRLSQSFKHSELSFISSDGSQKSVKVTSAPVAGWNLTLGNFSNAEIHTVKEGLASRGVELTLCNTLPGVAHVDTRKIPLLFYILGVDFRLDSTRILIDYGIKGPGDKEFNIDPVSVSAYPEPKMAEILNEIYSNPSGDYVFFVSVSCPMDATDPRKSSGVAFIADFSLVRKTEKEVTLALRRSHVADVRPELAEATTPIISSYLPEIRQALALEQSLISPQPPKKVTPPLGRPPRIGRPR